MRAWPLEALDVDVINGRPLAEWVFLRQPAARFYDLSAYGATRAAEQLASNALLSLHPREVRWAEDGGTRGLWCIAVQGGLGPLARRRRRAQLVLLCLRHLAQKKLGIPLALLLRRRWRS